MVLFNVLLQLTQVSYFILKNINNFLQTPVEVGVVALNLDNFLLLFTVEISSFTVTSTCAFFVDSNDKLKSFSDVQMQSAVIAETTFG